MSRASVSSDRCRNPPASTGRTACASQDGRECDGPVHPGRVRRGRSVGGVASTWSRSPRAPGARRVRTRVAARSWCRAWVEAGFTGRSGRSSENGNGRPEGTTANDCAHSCRGDGSRRRGVRPLGMVAQPPSQRSRQTPGSASIWRIPASVASRHRRPHVRDRIRHRSRRKREARNRQPAAWNRHGDGRQMAIVRAG